jgi:hypothetical protein
MPVVLAATTLLLGACSANGADTGLETAATGSSGTAASSGTVVVEESGATDVLPLPGPHPGADYATLPGGRYRIPLTDTLAFDVDVPDGTSSHEDGTFLAMKDFILKTEAAGDYYGVPRDPAPTRTSTPSDRRSTTSSTRSSTCPSTR